jgi:hypothetical protein
MKCGEPLAAQDQSTAVPVSDTTPAASPEAAFVGETAAASAESTSVNEQASAVDTGAKELKALLQEVEEEVHRQWGAEPQLVRENYSAVTMRTVSLAASSVPAGSDTSGPDMASEVTRSKRSAVIMLVLLLAVGGAVAAYYFRPLLLGVTAAVRPATTDGPTVAPSLSANPDSVRDEAKNSGEATAIAPGSTPAESSPSVPSVANPSPPAVEVNSGAVSTPPVAPASSEQTPEARPSTESTTGTAAPSPSPAARVDTAPQTSRSEPAATRTPPAPRTPKRADNIAETLSAERRAISATPAPRAMEPTVPENRPCSEAMQALALCSAPAPQ